MLLKAISHNTKGVVPFTGTLLTGVMWDDENPMMNWYKKMKDEPTTRISNAETFLIATGENKDEGLIFGGSDWSLQTEDLLEALEVVKGTGTKIAFQVPCDIETFEKRVGVQASKNAGSYESLKMSILTESDEEIFGFMGKTVLDELINDDYYVLAGLGDNLRYYFIEKDGDMDDLEI